MKKVELNLNEEDVWLLFVSAFRYALGRRTYMPRAVSGIILANRDKLTDWQCRQFVKEIEDYRETWGNLGDDCDEQIWDDFASKIVKEKD